MFRVYAARAGAWPGLHPQGGGRTRWAHFEFTRINICANYPPQKIDDLREVQR
jgi:hypothetical protein